METMISIGERLREERDRLGLTQGELAGFVLNCGVAGATRQSQGNYEKGKQQPSALYLAAIARLGVDTLYVLTGKRFADAAADWKVRAEQSREAKQLVEKPQSHGLAWRDVMALAVDELAELGVSLSGAKLAELVDVLMELQELGMNVDRRVVATQLRLVA